MSGNPTDAEIFAEQTRQDFMEGLSRLMAAVHDGDSGAIETELNGLNDLHGSMLNDSGTRDLLMADFPPRPQLH